MTAAKADQLIAAIDALKEAVLERIPKSSLPTNTGADGFNDKFTSMINALEAVCLKPPEPAKEQGAQEPKEPPAPANQ